MKSALYILDPQVGFWHEDIKEVFSDILSFAKSFDGPILISKFHNSLDTNFTKQLDWTRFSEDSDTKLIDGYDNLEATVFEHTTYSCLGLEVLDYLKEHQIDTLVMVGVFTDVCVSITAMEAFDKGYTTYVLSDLVNTLHGEQAHISELRSLDIILGSNYVIPSSQFEDSH